MIWIHKKQQKSCESVKVCNNNRIQTIKYILCIISLHPLQYNKNVLCALLIVGPILRIVFYKDLMKNHLHLLNVDKWVKFINIRLFAHPSFIKGISFCCTSIMSLILETYDSNLKFSYEITLCFIIIEEVNQDHGMFVTLIFILTHLKVIYFILFYFIQTLIL